MTPITPRDIARAYIDEERRINCSRLDVDHPVIIIGPDGTPMTAAWLSWGVRGELILQIKPSSPPRVHTPGAVLFNPEVKSAE